MLTLLGSFLGFLGSFAPKILEFFEAAQDHKRELEIMNLQIEAQKQGHIQRLEEINTKADMEVYKAAHLSDRDTGIAWVEALRGTVRPVVTYSFFLLYALTKAALYAMATHQGYDWAEAVVMLWSQPDMALFATVVSYWFGGRAVEKMEQWKRPAIVSKS